MDLLGSVQAGLEMLHVPNSLQDMRGQVMNAQEAAADAQEDMESFRLREGWGLSVQQKGVIRLNKVGDSLKQRMPQASDEDIIDISQLLQAFAHAAPLDVKRTSDPKPVFTV